MNRPEKLIFDDGEKWWCINGEFHREDGPAIIHADGRKEWWLNDRQYTEEDWFKEVVKRWSKP